MREKRERVKKGSGSSVNKRGRDVRWRRVSVREKRESAAKQSNELMCQCVRVTALSFIYIELQCAHKVSNTVIYADVENKYRGRFCTPKHTQNTYISAFMLCRSLGSAIWGLGGLQSRPLGLHLRANILVHRGADLRARTWPRRVRGAHSSQRAAPGDNEARRRLVWTTRSRASAPVSQASTNNESRDATPRVMLDGGHTTHRGVRTRRHSRGRSRQDCEMPFTLECFAAKI